MTKTIQIVMIAIAIFILPGCSSSKNGTDLKVTNGHLAGKWTISNISVDLPSDFKVTDVFDQAPYEDFKGSTWNLTRNGKGNFALNNGTKENIYWGIYGRGKTAQFQFKKLKGMKARDVTEGYRLQLQDISSHSFVAKSPVDLGNGDTGYIIYTFTK